MTFDPDELRRTAFPSLGDRVYLDVAARAPVSEQVCAAVEQFLSIRRGGGDKAEMLATIERVRAKVAALLGANVHEIAYTKNVSEGLNIIATALGLQPGESVVYAPEAEHPNNIYPWLHLQKTASIDLRAVPTTDGCIDTEVFVNAITPGTKLVTVSATTFAPGSRVNLRDIGNRCREVGAFFLVDGAQAVGVRDIDVERDCIDGLAFSTQKGLLGLYGMGFLYCRSEWADRMTPAYTSRFSLDLNGHEADFCADYAFRPAAQRFDLGNYNYLAATALEPSLDLLLRIGPPTIDHYLTGLSQTLRDGLAARGIPVIGGGGPAACHIVTAGMPSDTNDTINGDWFHTLFRQLSDAGIVISARRGLIRFSFHIYNTAHDIARVFTTIDRGANT